MRRIFSLAMLLVLGGCSAANGGGGDRGEPAPTADLGKPVTPETMENMPPQARAAAQQSMDRGAAMKAQMDKQYGGK